MSAQVSGIGRGTVGWTPNWDAMTREEAQALQRYMLRKRNGYKASVGAVSNWFDKAIRDALGGNFLSNAVGRVGASLGGAKSMPMAFGWLKKEAMYYYDTVLSNLDSALKSDSTRWMPGDRAFALVGNVREGRT